MKQSRGFSLFLRRFSLTGFPHFLTVAFIFSAVFSLSSPADSAFKDIPWGARPAGMAGAFSALSDDANSPAYNPAGLPQVRQTEVTLMYARLFSGLKLYAGNETSTLGLGSLSVVPQLSLPAGNMGFYWNSFQSQNVYREDTIGLAWGTRLYELYGPLPKTVSVGIGLKYLQNRFTLDQRSQSDAVFIDGTSASAFSFDLGLQWEPAPQWVPGLRLAAVAKNINEPDIGLSTQDPIPSEVRLGLALQNPRWRSLTPALEWISRDGENDIAFGVESWLLRNTLALRGGINSQEVAGGFSYRFSGSGHFNLQLDYTLLWPLILTDSMNHQISLTARFGTPRPIEEKTIENQSLPDQSGVYKFQEGEWMKDSPSPLKNKTEGGIKQ